MVRLWWLWWPQPARPPPQRWRQAAEHRETPRGVMPPQPDTTWCGCGGCTVVRPPPRWWFGGAGPPHIAALWRRQRGHKGGDLDKDGGIVMMAMKVCCMSSVVVRGGVERLPAMVEDGSEGGGVMKVGVLAGKGEGSPGKSAGEDGGSPEKMEVAGKFFRRRRRAVAAAGKWRGGGEGDVGLCSKVGRNMSRNKSWDEIVDKMVDRLSKWKMKTLSIGGRLTSMLVEVKAESEI
ncbi:hypothetical protein Tco_1525696 [Tanacetum coccineum]